MPGAVGSVNTQRTEINEALQQLHHSKSDVEAADTAEARRTSRISAGGSLSTSTRLNLSNGLNILELVGLLRNYCQQGRRTAELAELLATARGSTREADDRPLPQQNALHRSVVRLIIDDYEAGASTYELAKRYNVRRNTVRDTLRRAGFDLTAKSKRAALSEEQKAEARRLFASGATRRELMEMYGVSESTIRRVLRPRR